MTEAGPTLGELIVGVEGLALLRLLYADAAGVAGARAERIAEVRTILERSDRDSSFGSRVGVEFGLDEGYARWSSTYDRPLRLFSLEEPPMRQLLDPLPPGRILDAACGTGRWAAYLRNRGHEVVGVDQSVAMLDLARDKVPDSRFLPGEVTDLPLEDAAVDAAVCALALVHVPDLTVAIAELARVVRPGGRIVVSDVHPLLVMLGWQAQFPTDEGRAFMRLHRHLISHYLMAASAAGLVLRHCAEPLLTSEAAVTPVADVIPDANRAAYVGLPGVLILEFKRPV